MDAGEKAYHLSGPDSMLGNWADVICYFHIFLPTLQKKLKI
jgi:hypothetical protein